MPTEPSTLPPAATSDDRRLLASLKNWGQPPAALQEAGVARDVALDCGWGRLIFGQTFAAPERLAATIVAEAEGRRDVAFYVREPHVVLAAAPQALFLDPSHSFRLDLRAPPAPRPPGVRVRAATAADEGAINRLYRTWQMVPVAPGFVGQVEGDAAIRVLVAESAGPRGGVIGAVMGVDHHLAIHDPDNGASLWALAVDPLSSQPGVGAALVLTLAGRLREAGRAFMDLSVMHDNAQAIALYRKLGFDQVPIYSIKRKNPINEPLYVGPAPEARLNLYAQIIVDEARRRGITVEVEDAEAGLFRLILGGRAIACRESLCELTSAVAMSRCDDKALTRRLLARAGLRVPAQRRVVDDDVAAAFLAEHGRVVVKPARGEQGRGVAVDLRELEEVRAAIEVARGVGGDALIEQYVAGQDLRIIVIDHEVVAAAVRRPAAVRGDGQHTVRALIERQSRRRAAATCGESQIPIDAETERCVQLAGYRMTDIPDAGALVDVRKTANLHCGGTIHDVTARLHPALARASIEAARALDIPVVGLDLIVRDPAEPDYAFIEANERPGLANHEPAPTAERFVDLLFPQTRADAVRGPGAQQ